MLGTNLPTYPAIVFTYFEPGKLHIPPLHHATSSAQTCLARMLIGTN